MCPQVHGIIQSYLIRSSSFSNGSLVLHRIVHDHVNLGAFGISRPFSIVNQETACKEIIQLFYLEIIHAYGSLREVIDGFHDQLLTVLPHESISDQHIPGWSE